MTRILASGPVTANPDPGGLPGGSALQTLINGSLYFALAFTLLAFIIGTAAFALGRHGGNVRAAESGKLAMISGAVGAFLAGGAVTIINFFFAAGQAAH